jgi:LacI family transcriptional regulator
VSGASPTRVTVTDVARAAGVARATAARVLGGYGSVHAGLQERVREAAAALGYQPNTLARSMATGVTHTIGVVVADIARAAGYDTIVVNTDESAVREQDAVRVLLGKQIDGLVVASAVGAADDPAHLRAAVERGVPVVAVDRELPALDVDAVVIDNHDIAAAAVRHLTAAGHRRVALAWGPALPHRPRSLRTLLDASGRDLPTSGARLRGWADALTEAGHEPDPALVMTGSQTIEGVRRFVTRQLQADDPATAVFATETDAVLGTLAAARDLGLRIPEDLSVVGFDDSPWATVTVPALTMVEQPVRQLGQTAAARLVQRIEGRGAGAARTRALRGRLVERDSVAAPRA